MQLASLLPSFLATAIALAAAWNVRAEPAQPRYGALPQTAAATAADWSPLPECAGFPLDATYDYQGLSGSYVARDARAPGQAQQLSLLVTRADQVPRVDGQYIGSFVSPAGPAWRAGRFSGLPSNPASGNGFLLFFGTSEVPEYIFSVAAVIKHPVSGQILGLCLYDGSGSWPPSGRPFTMWRVL